MFSGILKFILIVGILFGAGFLSYTYLEQTMGTEATTPILEVGQVSIALKTPTAKTVVKVATRTASI